jgi:thermitase
MKIYVKKYPAVILISMGIVIILLVVSIGASPGPFRKRFRHLNGHVKDEIIVKFKKNTSFLQQSNRISRTGLRKSDVTRDAVVIKLREGENVEEAIKEYKDDPSVEYAQPNYIYHAYETIPNDTGFSSLWGLKNTGQTIIASGTAPEIYTKNNPGTAKMDMDAVLAWDQITDCSSVIVAVLDSGINYNHEDLAANMWDGSSCNDAGGVPIAGGCLHGYNYISDDNDPMDLNGHGTHVAGTIGARGNNNTGTTGVCWQVHLMAVRVLDELGSGTTDGVISGINFAVQNGAQVLNMSFGGPSYDQALYDAINNAKNNGVVIAAAAGNDGLNNDSTPEYPCNFNLDNIICVAALDQSYQKADFSNYGRATVDVGAPGVNILSEWAGTIQSIADDFNNFGTLDWTRSGNLEWDYKVYSGYDCLTNPVNFDWSSHKYKNSINADVYKIFTLNGNEDAVTLTFISKFETEPLFDYFGIYYGTKIDNPATTGTPLALYTGSTGNNFYLFQYNMPNCTNNTRCTVGFKLYTNSSINYRGVAITYFYIDTLTLNTGSYRIVNGTSMAAPHVAGLAAMLFAYNPAYDYKDVVNSIKYGGEIVSSLSGITTTGRAVNAWGSLQYINKPTGVTAQKL